MKNPADFMQYDQEIIITTCVNRFDTNCKQQKIWISDMRPKIFTPGRDVLTRPQYDALPRKERENRKDVGGFVAGELRGPRRKANAMINRSLITLDCDKIPPGGLDPILRCLEGFNIQYCLYTTRNHSAASPRARILIIPDRVMTLDEHEYIARYLASLIGMDYFDRTTFAAERIMFWPSVCADDSEYQSYWPDKPPLSVDGLLAQNPNWRDITTWPRPSSEKAFVKPATKLADPTTKPGVVGAFCRIYNIHQAIAAFLPDKYEAAEGLADRYTHLGGTSTNGVIIYDDGLHLRSYHASDPCGDRMVNAFDLVRIHKFEHMDDDAKSGTPSNRLQSYKAMQGFALEDESVKRLMTQEDFAETEQTAEDDLEWTQKLEKQFDGTYKKTLNNVILVIENHPALKGRIKLDIFAQRIQALDGLPWELKKETSIWEGEDLTALRLFLERWFKPTKADVKDAVEMVAKRNGFHPVRDYLLSLKWDGVPRLDTMFMDYLGVEDSVYTGMITRKSLTACVKRVMEPGCKMDYMVVFIGKQGFKKSKLIQDLTGESDWFSDSLSTFHGKEAMETVRGKWLIEIPELHAFYRSELNMIKAFITRRSDDFRAAFGEYVKNNPRQCVFFGTTNDPECLRDATGGRRFWPVEVDKRPRIKDVDVDLPGERDQIWAEAVKCWRDHETLYLPPDIELQANKKQEYHRESHPMEDTIVDFISQEVPEGWLTWSAESRESFWKGTYDLQPETKMVPRDRVCVLEIWTEVLKPRGYLRLDLPEKRLITSVLNRSSEWERGGTMYFGKVYGRQNGFIRKAVLQ